VPSLDDGVGGDQEFPGTGDESNIVGFAARDEAGVEATNAMFIGRPIDPQLSIDSSLATPRRKIRGLWLLF
jgi:hypothetical protein